MNNHSEIYDLEKAVDLAGGNRKLALELINMLIEQLPAEKIEISQSFSDNDITSLKQQIHKLHGSSQCCGTAALTIAAKDFEAVIENNTSDRFASCYKQLLMEIDSILALDVSSLNLP